MQFAALVRLPLHTLLLASETSVSELLIDWAEPSFGRASFLPVGDNKS